MYEHVTNKHVVWVHNTRQELLQCDWHQLHDSSYTSWLLTFEELCSNLRHNLASWGKRKSFCAPPHLLNGVTDALANIAPVVPCQLFCLHVTQKNYQCHWHQYALECQVHHVCNSNMLSSKNFEQRNVSSTSTVLLDKRSCGIAYKEHPDAAACIVLLS